MKLVHPLLWKKHILSALLLGILSLTPETRADFTLTFVESPAAGAVTVTYNGFWNLPGTTSFQNTALNGDYYLRDDMFYSLTLGQIGYRPLANIPIYNVPWNGNSNFGTAQSGDPFGFDSIDLYGPDGFTASTHIQGTLTFSGYSLASLGFDASEIANGGSFAVAGTTISWVASVIPEPSSFALLVGAGILGVSAFRRRRRQS